MGYLYKKLCSLTGCGLTLSIDVIVFLLVDTLRAVASVSMCNNLCLQFSVTLDIIFLSAKSSIKPLNIQSETVSYNGL